MKTPIQKLLQDLHEQKRSAPPLYAIMLLTAISFAEAMLRKEKEVICKFADDYKRNSSNESAEDYFEDTFDTDEL